MCCFLPQKTEAEDRRKEEAPADSEPTAKETDANANNNNNNTNNSKENEVTEQSGFNRKYLDKLITLGKKLFYLDLFAFSRNRPVTTEAEYSDTSL